MSNELLELPATEQARRLREREISSEELTRLYLDRVRTLNPALGAFVQVLEAAALRDARRKDKELARARKSGERLAPFHGVPTGVKDLNLARGAFTRFGSRATRYFWSPLDDKTVARLRRGGFVIAGKLATSEFGVLPVTETAIHPPARNPWNRDHSPGGSSGGSGAAVAARLVPIAQGSDGAGSIRIPSSFCGLYGIKPSRGRVPNAFGFPDQRLLYTDGPLARSVDDAAAMLDVMAGLTANAPHWAPPPPATFAELTRSNPGRLKVRFTTKNPIVETHPEVVDAVHTVVRTLEQLGHQVEEGSWSDGTVEEFLPLWQFMTRKAPVFRWALVEPVTRWLADAARDLKDADVIARHVALENRVDAWFEGVDLWVSPTVPGLPPRIGSLQGLSPEAAFARAAQVAPFTAPFNLSGQPAASLPVAISREGLPIGVQLAGARFADGTVLAVSRQLEEALGCVARCPPEYGPVGAREPTRASA
jgi:amidase